MSVSDVFGHSPTQSEQSPCSNELMDTARRRKSGFIGIPGRPQRHMLLAKELEKLKGRPLLAKVLANTGWLVGDKVLRIGVGLLVTVWIARYLGPEQFGKWNYAIAFATLFGSFATLGLDSIVVRDLVHRPENTNQILGTAFALKVIASTAAIFIVTASMAVFKPHDTELIFVVAFTAGAFLFQASNVIDFYFQASIKSKFSVIAQNAAFVIMAIVKLVLLFNHATLMQFVFVTLLEAVLTAAFMFWAFLVRVGNTISLWRFDTTYAARILKDSFPLILTGLAISIYYKIGLIMIGEMSGEKAVGIYSAAMRLSEAWYFVPMAITTSVFPSFVEKRKRSEAEYVAATQKFFDLMFLLALAVALATTVIGPKIISLLYGARFEGADSILVLHIWAGVFVCSGLASGAALTAQGLQKYSFYRTLIGCVANVALNWILIPPYGGMGAAAATVLSYAISTFSIGFFRPGREIFYMLLRSLNIFRPLKLLY